MLNRRDTLRGLALTMGAAATGFAGRAFAAPALSWTPTALNLDPARLSYTALADLPGATEKARRDAPAIAVTEL